MINKQYKKASEWIKGFKLSSIKDEDVLLCMNMSQLRLVASKMNKEMGQVIVKSQFGKTWSRMNKQELINAIWYVRRVVLCSPKGSYSLLPLSQRIAAQFCDGVQHVVYFGFQDEKEATKFFYYLNEHVEFDSLAALRPADRMKGKFSWEVKVWDINGELLASLVTRDKKAEERARIDAQTVANQAKYAEAEIAEIAAEEMTHGETIDIHSAQRMYNRMKVKEKSHKAIISFLGNRGYEVVNDIVEYAF